MRIGIRHEATGNSKKVQVYGFALSALLLALCVSAEAQQPRKVYRIGYLAGRTDISRSDEAFRQALRDLGYIEGENLVIEWRFTGPNPDRYSEFAVELVRLKVDCIVTVGLSLSRAAKQSTSTIPIVMANVSDDPVRNELIDSLARPGGNITGFTDIANDLAGKRLELIKETLPKASRVAVLWYSSPVARTQLQETEIAARPLGVRIQSLEVRSSEDFDHAFEMANKQRAEALIAVSFGGLLNNNNRQKVVSLATKHRLPAMYSGSVYVEEAGGLMSYAPDGPDRHRRAAGYVDKILKGTKPADLPVQQPTKFEFVINLKAPNRSASRFRRTCWRGQIG